MKKVVIGIIACAVVAGIIVTLALLGVRITYAPELAIDWDAISAIAGWAAVIVSGLAIYYAIQVPKKIAEEQNRIALFEKRYAFYSIFCRCISFAACLENAQTKSEARRLFFAMMSDEVVEKGEDALRDGLPVLLTKTISVLDQGTYLFPFDTNTVLEPFVKDLLAVLMIQSPSVGYFECRERAKASAKKAKDTLTEPMQKVLALHK